MKSLNFRCSFLVACSFLSFGCHPGSESENASYKGQQCKPAAYACGPFTPVERKLCIELGGGNECTTNKWNKAIYDRFIRPTATRGAMQNRTFPKGGGSSTTMGTWIPDPSFDEIPWGDEQVISDDMHVYGTFSPELIALCKRYQGGNACDTNRWNKDFYYSLLSHLQSQSAQAQTPPDQGNTWPHPSQTLPDQQNGPLRLAGLWHVRDAQGCQAYSYFFSNVVWFVRGCQNGQGPMSNVSFVIGTFAADRQSIKIAVAGQCAANVQHAISREYSLDSALSLESITSPGQMIRLQKYSGAQASAIIRQFNLATCVTAR